MQQSRPKTKIYRDVLHGLLLLDEDYEWFGGYVLKVGIFWAIARLIGQGLSNGAVLSVMSAWAFGIAEDFVNKGCRNRSRNY